MKISIGMILYLLPELKEINLCKLPDIDYKGVTLFSGSLCSLKQDVLYIATAEEAIKCSPEVLQDATVLLAGKREGQEELIAKREQNRWLTYPGEYSLAAAFEQIGSAFEQINDWSHRLSLSVYQDEDVSALLKIGEEVVKAPIAIWDSSFQFVYTSNFDERVDKNPVLQQARRLGRWPGEVVDQMLSQTDYLSQAWRYRDLYLVSLPSITNCCCATQNLMIDNKVIMTVEAFFVDKPPMQGEFELLKILVAQIYQCLKCSPIKFMGHKKIYEAFIQELLEERLVTEEEIQERLKYINFRYDGLYEIFVLEGDKDSLNFAMGLARNFCKQMFPYSKLVEYQGTLVGLNLRAEEKRQELSLPCGNQIFTIGVSHRFQRINQIHSAWLQAKSAIYYGRLLNPDLRCYLFADYYLYNLIHERLKEYKNRFFYCDADYIYQLREMDKQKNLNNEILLHTYLKNDKNTSFTARDMNMHKNTVLYRLGQIEDKLRINLGDSDLCFRLMFGYKVVGLIDALIKNHADGFDLNGEK